MSASHALARVLLAAPSTGAGKTTLATGVMAALRRRGLEVSGHKVGPDYIDPGYHALATGRPGRNLDPHLVGEERVAPLLLHGASTPRPADVAVIEGVMGLFDGRVGTDGFASSAHVATLTRTPVVLVVDCARASRTVGAVVHGLVTYDPSVQVAGVILNRVGSPRHAAEVASSVRVPVLGQVPRDESVATPSRHLGLVPAAERGMVEAELDPLVALVEAHVDLDAVLDVARSAPELEVEPWSPPLAPPRPAQTRAGALPVVAVAGGRAFTFRYAETEELLRAAGCDVVVLDPTSAPALPAGVAGLYLGGGFPEVHVNALAENVSLVGQLRDAVRSGLPTVAECAGLLYLCRTLDGVSMIGAIDADAAMHERLTLRYPEAVAVSDSLLTRVGESVTGHEFHRTRVTPTAGAAPAWRVADGPHGAGFGAGGGVEGFTSPTLHASYLHTHWAGQPQMAQRFVEAVRAW
ncbi:cobyrinate a,c-diamide synthase [Nocardioides sp. BSK12Z-4]|uniref:Hydrogenobyrinate a,c-diamide synthase n=1 Tax=Nocardioides bruguierae TaxID=2945102 RepID=A0A9X2D8P1_9ACTN|nr:cobyrinate a,c-diamide synthase [Nocardioides bruguierae]MCL8026938.1 cobyrinate a,c-diamide synthase [Nocardioides bruguierae]MCM0621357.1 cobyrinate a,c-diamide synthase [Nocardioides bruguierae]